MCVLALVKVKRDLLPNPLNRSSVSDAWQKNAPDMRVSFSHEEIVDTQPPEINLLQAKVTNEATVDFGHNND
jgi:hypothetical protein